MTKKELSPREKLIEIETQLNSWFVNREKEISGMLVSLLSGQHVFLLGPPGTGKSRLISLFTQMVGGTKFEWQLTKFSKLEDLFGPISISNLKKDKMVRVGKGKLQEADFAYIDEIWKANSAVLNALLAATNERIFYDGGGKLNIPLVSMFCASNELPSNDSLDAIYDRILFRYHVEDLTPEQLVTVICNPVPKKTKQIINLDEIREMQQEVKNINIDVSIIEALMEIKVSLEKENILNFSRRYIETVKALKAYAYLTGEDEVSEDHFEILSDILWRKPEERSVVVEKVITIAAPQKVIIREILDSAEETIRTLPSIEECSNKTEFFTKVSNIIDILQDQKKELKGFEGDKVEAAIKDLDNKISRCTKEIVKRSRS